MAGLSIYKPFNRQQERLFRGRAPPISGRRCIGATQPDSAPRSANIRLWKAILAKSRQVLLGLRIVACHKGRAPGKNVQKELPQAVED